MGETLGQGQELASQAFNLLRWRLYGADSVVQAILCSFMCLPPGGGAAHQQDLPGGMSPIPAEWEDPILVRTVPRQGLEFPVLLPSWWQCTHI